MLKEDQGRRPTAASAAALQRAAAVPTAKTAASPCLDHVYLRTVLPTPPPPPQAAAAASGSLCCYPSPPRTPFHFLSLSLFHCPSPDRDLPPHTLRDAGVVLSSHLPYHNTPIPSQPNSRICETNISTPTSIPQRLHHVNVSYLSTIHFIQPTRKDSPAHPGLPPNPSSASSPEFQTPDSHPSHYLRLSGRQSLSRSPPEFDLTKLRHPLPKSRQKFVQKPPKISHLLHPPNFGSSQNSYSQSYRILFPVYWAPHILWHSRSSIHPASSVPTCHVSRPLPRSTILIPTFSIVTTTSLPTEFSSPILPLISSPTPATLPVFPLLRESVASEHLPCRAASRGTHLVVA